ncbi:mediator of RNA polymerase II transcription subunit 9 isoform X1 [Sitodiplosis mosellana]|uniref:mediator of RNA polymerase II transcription subunit 9 isoform X1 n=1 Tax=Sitodiplosis mosellana TaxID=263140 RepID=UPI0024450080|nr:mediator of RNA polymerase II transcription subunit 9 isoform X1 [Sitodiplosis mosellana]
MYIWIYGYTTVKYNPMDKKTLSTASSKHITSNQTTLTVDQLDIEILPIIYEIIRCFEKDPTDNAAKQRESQDCSQKVIELQRRLDNARSQIGRLSGINHNKEEQLHRLELLRNQLKQKQHLIKKYKNIQF